MSKTAVESSGEVNVRVASHLSNLPTIATEALTLNFIELSTGVISNTGTFCAVLSDGNKIDAQIQKKANRPNTAVGLLGLPGWTSLQQSLKIMFFIALSLSMSLACQRLNRLSRTMVFSFFLYAFGWAALQCCGFAADTSGCAQFLVGGLLRRDPNFEFHSTARSHFFAFRSAATKLRWQQRDRAVKRS